MKKIILITALFGGVLISHAQNLEKYYNRAAGQNAPMEAVTTEDGKLMKDAKGVQVYREASKDHHGNSQGNQYDLAVDGAFDGQTVAVLHLYTGEEFDFALPKAALAEKGFSVYRWLNEPPSPEELEKKLEKACQLWIISSNVRKLSDAHIKVIKKFFDSGKGVYIWGDNDPYYADANVVAEALLGVSMSGNIMGDKTVSMYDSTSKQGLAVGHLITTGLQYVYEGITIATISSSRHLTPLIYGSAGNLVAATYEKDGKRAIIDGGFTRLYVKWDTAGTGRYVKNAAAWLVNLEKLEQASGN